MKYPIFQIFPYFSPILATCFTSKGRGQKLSKSLQLEVMTIVLKLYPDFFSIKSLWLTELLYSEIKCSKQNKYLIKHLSRNRSTTL
jgi:hypothetical protein